MIVEYRQTYLNHGKNQICAQGFRGQELVYPTRKVSFLYKNIEAFRIWKTRYCKKSLNSFNFDIRPIILDLTFRLLSHRLDNPSVLMSLNQMNTHTHSLSCIYSRLLWEPTSTRCQLFPLTARCTERVQPRSAAELFPIDFWLRIERCTKQRPGSIAPPLVTSNICNYLDWL